MESLKSGSLTSRRGKFRALFTYLIMALPLAGHAVSSKVAQYSKLPEAEKIDVNLLRMEHEMRTESLSLAAATRNMALAKTGHGIMLDIATNDIRPGDQYKFELSSVTVTHFSPKYNRVSVTIDEPGRLYDLAKLPEVRTIATQYPAIASTGSVDGFGDEALRADVARTKFAVDGAGQIVGILSNSFARTRGVRDVNTRPPAGVAGTLTGSKPQDSGDLPPTINLRGDNVIIGATDEGAGMAELVSDIAPRAGIAFHTSGDSEAAFADGIDDLCAPKASRGAGATVVVDDVLILGEATYQDDIIAQAATHCVASGVPFFSAAGNQSNRGLRYIYKDINAAVDDQAMLPTGQDLHRFGGGDGFLKITLPAGASIIAILGWNQPNDSVSPGRGAQIDLDLFATRTPSAAGLAHPVTSSTSAQGTTDAPRGDAFEGIRLVNRGATGASYFLAVDHFRGSQGVIPQNAATPLQFQLAFFGLNTNAFTIEGIPNSTSAFGGPTIYGHTAATGVTSVAAVPFYETAAFDPSLGRTVRTDPEPFTSRGGRVSTQFGPLGFFNLRRHFEPDITAVDGDNTTFFPPGFDLQLGGAFGEPDGRPNFPGTSAAAPNAAAVAALMQDKAGNGLTPAQVSAVLRATAIDIVGFRAAPGRDDVTGDGLIDAQAALARVRPPSRVATRSHCGDFINPLGPLGREKAKVRNRNALFSCSSRLPTFRRTANPALLTTRRARLF